MTQKLPGAFTKIDTIATVMDAVSTLVDLAKNVWRTQDTTWQTDVKTKLDDLHTDLTDLSTAVKDPVTGETLASLAKDIKLNTDKLSKLDKLDNLDDIKLNTDKLETIKENTGHLETIKDKSVDILGKLSVLDAIKDAILSCCVGCDIQLDSDGKPSTKTCQDGTVVPAIVPCPRPQASVTCANGQPVVNCTGDPVNCALLKSTSAADCGPEPDSSQFSADNDPPKPPIDENPKDPFSNDGDGSGSRYTVFLLGLLPFLEPGPSQDDSVDVSDQLDKDGLGWDDSCPAPQVYSLGALGQLTIDYQPFCDLAEINGFLVIFVASMVSLRILFSVV